MNSTQGREQDAKSGDQVEICCSDIGGNAGLEQGGSCGSEK